MAFEDDSYIVLDIPPADWSDKVLELRRQLDPWRAELPLEITLAGSGGVGPIEARQDPEDVFRVLKQIAADTEPLSVEFHSIAKFPGTHTYYLVPSAEEALVQLHEKIIGSGIRFSPAPFPFVAHCTIANVRDPDSEPLIERTLGPYLPLGPVLLRDLVIYSIAGSACSRVATCTVGKRQ